MLEFKINESTPWAWAWAEHINVPQIVELAQSNFQQEMDHIFHIDPDYYAWQVDRAVTNQSHNLAAEQILIAVDKFNGQLLCYAWIGRGSHIPFSQDEVAEAKMLHLDLALGVRQRMVLCAQAISHWQTWAEACDIPVLISSSIRGEQRGFMRLHEKMGFTVRGSIAYKRLKDLK